LEEAAQGEYASSERKQLLHGDIRHILSQKTAVSQPNYSDYYRFYMLALDVGVSGQVWTLEEIAALTEQMQNGSTQRIGVTCFPSRRIL
jgi:hypothetical protein